MLTRFRTRLSREDGFTLIELLVVMIIIGILAAVAIPIFLNQQKTARDTQTVSDVKNIATNIQSMLVKNPDANYFVVHSDTTLSYTEPNASTTVGRTRNAAGDLYVRVAPINGLMNFDDTKVSASQGTTFIVYGEGGQFTIKAWNTSGKSYTDAASAVVYDSADGGLKK